MIKDPKDVAAVFGRLFNEGNLSGMMALYQKDAVYVGGDGRELRGPEAIEGALRGFLALKASMKIELASCQVQGDIALVSNRWTLSGGALAAPRSGRSVEIMRRQPDGSWLYAVDLPGGMSP